MKLPEGIKYLIENLGCDYLSHPGFCNALNDIQAIEGQIGYVNIIKTLYERNLIEKIIEDIKVNNTPLMLIITSLWNKLSPYSYRRNDVEYVIYSLAYGLGCLDKNFIPGYQQDEYSKKYLGPWIFNYKDNETTKLIIKADGSALNETGTKYRWEINEGSIKIFLKGMVSYGGNLINDDQIQGYAFSELNQRTWIWNAYRILTQLSEKYLKMGEWKIINNINGLDDDIIKFKNEGKLESENYGIGNWYIEDEKLVIRTANGVIVYNFIQDKDSIKGKGWNIYGVKWNNCELIKIK